MPVIIEELTAEVEPPPVSNRASQAAGGESPEARETKPVELVRIMDRLAERALRLEAD